MSPCRSSSVPPTRSEPIRQPGAGTRSTRRLRRSAGRPGHPLSLRSRPDPMRSRSAGQRRQSPARQRLTGGGAGRRSDDDGGGDHDGRGGRDPAQRRPAVARPRARARGRSGRAAARGRPPRRCGRSWCGGRARPRPGGSSCVVEPAAVSAPGRRRPRHAALVDGGGRSRDARPTSTSCGPPRRPRRRRPASSASQRQPSASASGLVALAGRG